MKNAKDKIARLKVEEKELRNHANKIAGIIRDLEYAEQMNCKHTRTRLRTASYSDEKTPYFEYQERYCVKCKSTINE